VTLRVGGWAATFRCKQHSIFLDGQWPTRRISNNEADVERANTRDIFNTNHREFR
jgi:hypothetical protein